MNNTPTASIIKILILPIYLPSTIISIGFGMVMLIIPLYAYELTGSYGQASLVFAMMGVGTLISDVPAGIFISKVGLKVAMFTGIAVIALATVLSGSIHSTLLLGIAIFVMGIGRGITMLSRMTYIADMTSDQRGRAMAAVGGVMRIGMFIGPILGGFLSRLFSYGSMLVFSGVLIGTALGFTRFIKTGKPLLVATTRKRHGLKFVGQILSDYRSVFLTAGSAVFGLQLLRSGRYLIVPLWGTFIGLDAADIGLISGIAMGLEMTMFYPVGIIMDRFGRKWVAVPCISILALAIGLIPLSDSFYSLFMIILLAAIGNGLGSGIFLTLGADFSPDHRRSEFLGVWRLLGDTGHMTSPFIVGALAGGFSLAAAAISISAIGMVAAAIMLFLVKESR